MGFVQEPLSLGRGWVRGPPHAAGVGLDSQTYSRLAASAPSPFATFLASIGTCAGIYVLGFCQQRGLPTEGMRIIQRMHTDRTTGMVGKIELEIQAPPSFPEKYLPALIR